MAHIILVHGIGHQQSTADGLEATWLPALAGGIRLAGFIHLADRLWRERRPGELETRMAFYGDVFRVPGQQGVADDILNSKPALAERLAEEWLQRASVRASRPQDRRIAEIELRYLHYQQPQMQGPYNRMRKASASVARIGFFARAGMSAARLVAPALAQVTSYLTDECLRGAVQQRVQMHIDKDTQVLIGHSLGAVIAFEVAHQLERPLPLLVTLGSPLGIRTIVREHVRPQPITFPPRVRKWANFADPDDVIAAEPELAKLLASSSPPGCQYDSDWIVDNDAKPHSALSYLGKKKVGQAVGDVLQTGHVQAH